ncbi:MAG TPA: hypothetical protein VFC18_12115 [Burkholderiales bacterium]|nr:hypothetical protein [Burkholderiales bacterium]
METCTEEVGFLKKKPCGEAAVTHCANCEQPLCSKHASPEMSATGRKTGKFMCKQCGEAAREYARTEAAGPKPAAPKPAAPSSPSVAKPAAPQQPEHSLGAIEFTLGDKPKP